MAEHRDIAENVARISHLDLPGAGQVEVVGNYAYIGHMDPPHGTSILDISDLKNPKIVSQIMLEDDQSHTHKARVVGDILYTNVELFNRHYRRRGDGIPDIRAGLEKDGKEPSDSNVAAQMNIRESEVAVLDAQRERGYHDGGFKVYDIKDKAAPKLLKHVRTSGFGTHRFDVDENYAYISTEMEGYQGNILVIYDCVDPSNPKEVSHWWMPGQKISAGEKPYWNADHRRLHHGLRFGDRIWAAAWHGGYWLIDVSDITNPTTICTYDTNPPFIEPAHTLMPLTQEIDGMKIAVGMDEQHGQITGQPPAGIYVFDVTDETQLKPISVFVLSELDSPYARKGGRFGAHQFHEKPIGTLIFATWFNGGLRVVDVADPYAPKEVGHFMPAPVDGHASPQSNDVFATDNGIIFLADRFNGFDILEWQG